MWEIPQHIVYFFHVDVAVSPKVTVNKSWDLGAVATVADLRRALKFANERRSQGDRLGV